MRFQVTDLGRLKEANVDISKRLIIFCGRNNTSKTYVAHALYGFCDQYFYILCDSILRKYVHIESGLQTVQIDFEQVLRNNLRDILRDLGTEYAKNLADVFAADDFFAKDARVNIEIPDEELEKIIGEFMSENSDGEDLQILDGRILIRKEKDSGMLSFASRPNPSDLLQKVDESTSLKSSENDDFALAVYIGLGMLLSQYALSEFGALHHVLSAERSAIQLFSHELSLRRNELVDKMLLQSQRIRFHRDKGTQTPLDLLEMRARRYPLPIQNSLKIADDLANLGKTKTELNSLADWIETEILQGTIQINAEGDMKFHPSEADKSLAMHLASSSVKALAGLIFYIRHLIRPHHLVIIDEPELNLHPDNQRLVARLLARMVNADVRVLISTHSEYIIREINNLVMLNMDSDGSKLEKFGYKKEDVLPKEEIGAYLFTGTTAIAIEVTDTGMQVAPIDEELNKINTLSQDLYYSFFAQKTED